MVPETTPEVAVKVTAPVLKGSIVLVSNMVDEEEIPRLQASLRHNTGHEKFLIIRLGEGQALSVHGPDDLKVAIWEIVREVFDDLWKEIPSV